jgi:hypothetical protein
MEIINKININAPVDTAWQILGEEFGEVSRWAGPVTASSLAGPLGEGVMRTCEIKATGPFPAGEVTETLSEFNRQNKTLTYVIDSGGPPFVSHIQNRWILEARDATSSVASSTVTYGLKWWAVPFAPLISMLMRSALKPIFDEFRDAVEARSETGPSETDRFLTQVA